MGARSGTQKIVGVAEALGWQQTDWSVGKSRRGDEQERGSDEPTQAERSRARREQILDAAFHTFTRRGYRDTAVDDIAAAAETSKGGVYFHFPTKEAIFRELIKTTADRLAAKVERAVAEQADPIARADAALRTVLLTFAGHRTMARLLFVDAMGAGRVFNAETNALHDRFAGMIAGYLDEAIAEGAIPPIDTALTGRRLVRGTQRGRGAVAADRRPGAARNDLPDAARAPAAKRRRRRGAHRRPPDAVVVTVTDRRHGSRRGRRSRRTSRPPHGGGDRWPAAARRQSRSDRPHRPDRPLRGGPRLDLESALWLQPAAGRSIVGIGRAWAVEGGGPDRFVAAATAWRRSWRTRSAGRRTAGSTGPVLLGGLGFAGGRASVDEPWAPFGPSSLVLPTFTRRATGTGALLTVAVAPGRPGRPRAGRRRDRLERHRRTQPDASRPRRPRTARSGSVDDARTEPPGSGPSACSPARSVAAGSTRSSWPVGVAFEAPADLDVAAALRHLAATAPESATFAFSRGGRRSSARPRSASRAPSGARSRPSRSPVRRRAARTPIGRRPFAAALLASEKDREEHAVVVDALRAELAPIVETLSVADAPRVLALRHLQHLVTPMTGTLREEAGLLAPRGAAAPDARGRRRAARRRARPDRRTRRLRSRLVRAARSAGSGPTATAS